MRHTCDDGLGAREVWLDGFLLDCVVECDDEAATAVVVPWPVQIVGGEIATAIVSGEVMVVRPIDGGFGNAYR